MRKTSIPNLREVIGGTKTKIYCQANLCRTRVLAVPRTIKVGLTKVGNQAKPLNYLKIKVYLTSLKQMFKRMATNLDLQPTPKQQRLTCAISVARLLSDGCCGLNDTDNKILFRINW